MKITVARYIANFFVEHGLKNNFTVTGGGAMFLNDALGHHPEIISTYHHHEQAAAIAAEGFARLTNKPAIVCVTTGPGGTNALTGVLGAWLDSIPMIVISEQVKFSTTIASTDVPLRQLGDQEFNIVDAVRAMTKYAEMIVEPTEIRRCLEQMLYSATHGPDQCAIGYSRDRRIKTVRAVKGAPRGRTTDLRRNIDADNPRADQTIETTGDLRGQRDQIVGRARKIFAADRSIENPRRYVVGRARSDVGR